MHDGHITYPVTSLEDARALAKKMMQMMGEGNMPRAGSSQEAEAKARLLLQHYMLLSRQQQGHTTPPAAPMASPPPPTTRPAQQPQHRPAAPELFAPSAPQGTITHTDLKRLGSLSDIPMVESVVEARGAAHFVQNHRRPSYAF
eukprot:Sspe_Gene.77070::Locus_48137_Transcript_1_1_Confidence_1.000_Length_850::g.77070::m.77070